MSLVAQAARVAACAGLASALCASGGRVDFNRDVRPILSDKCFACHGPDASNRKAGLRLDTESGATQELRGKRFPIVPGQPDRSEVFKRIASDNKALRMPPAYTGHEKLGVREIEVIRRWILDGAKYEGHWSFIKPTRPALPEVRENSWPRNAIDHFVLAKLEREGLKPSPEADRTTLLRRVTLDLTGLPPTPAEIEAFLKDPSKDAYEQAVDRLLASPRYAERMALPWLNAARYADTHGYQADGQRDMWRWRDWVIDAFHRNMPFDQFTIEQIAGDLLPGATLEQKIATGFHRNHRTNGEGGIVEEEFRVEYVADRVETTATVWLGLTMGCARCHDHKYDPVKQKDFYRMFAFFNNVPERGLVYNFGNDEPYVKAPTPEHGRRLAELDAAVAQAEQQYAALQPKLLKQQRKWEKKLLKAAPLNWSIEEGLVLHEPLQERRFDGSQSINKGDKVANFDYLDPFTLAAWIKPESPDGTIVSRIEDYLEGEGYSFYVLDGKLRLHITKRYTDISLRVETAEPIRLHEWQHVAVTYDGKRKGSGVHMFVDGQERPLKILFDDLNYPLAAKEPFRIGAGGGHHFRGGIEEVWVYSRALSSDEVATLPLRATMNELAAKSSRTKAEKDKLAFCFVTRFAPEKIRQARLALLARRIDRDKYFASIPTVMVMAESDTPRETFVLKRGAYDAPGEKVTAATPIFLHDFDKTWPRNRLGLAKWLVSSENPLTARVTVNRFWQMYFGTGLVKTVEDFGSQGEWPLHPALLDWLATEFVRTGWNVKAMHRLIVTSATYRQSSKVTPELLQRDPENRLLARGARLRLPAETIRDNALAISGLLAEKSGGPSAKPYQPPGLWQELAGGKGYETDKGEALYRRSLYTFWKRTVPPPSMSVFDAPTREVCTVRESRTNTPLQALNLMNDVAYLEAARKLAERMVSHGGIPQGFQLATARKPTEAESKLLHDALERFLQRYKADPKAALAFLAQGESKPSPKINPSELAAYTAVASLILNLDEVITKE